MRLNKNELLFINEVTKGPAPFGIILSYPKEEHVEEFKKEVLQSLKEKEFIDSKEKFTEKGIALLLVWEEYRKCSKHLILNQMYLSVGSNRRVVGIVRDEEEYDVFSTDSVAIMAKLIESYEFLGKKDNKVSIEVEKVSYDDWVEELERCQGDILVLGEFQDKTPETEEVYYWKEDKGYRYNINLGYRRQMSPRDMRLRFLRYLEIREEIGGNG